LAELKTYQIIEEQLKLPIVLASETLTIEEKEAKIKEIRRNDDKFFFKSVKICDGISMLIESFVNIHFLKLENKTETDLYCTGNMLSTNT
jgi:hypothetical protein